MEGVANGFAGVRHGEHLGVHPPEAPTVRSPEVDLFCFSVSVMNKTKITKITKKKT